MKEKHDIDKLLRASLDPYRPVPGEARKKKFLDEAGGLLPQNPPAGPIWRPVTVAIILIAITGSLVWYFTTTSKSGLPGAEKAGSETQVNEKSIPAEENVILTTTEKNTDNREKTTIKSKDDKTEQQDLPVARATITSNETQGILPGEPVSGQQPFQSENPPKPVQADTIVSDPLLPGTVASDASGSDPVLPVLEASDAIISDTSKTDILRADTSAVPDQSAPVQKKGGITMMGLFYRPEKIYQAVEGDKWTHSIGIEYQYRPYNPKYIFRAGIGITVSPGYYEYGVDYNEFMGTYQHLDSVTFTLAPDQFHLTPTYHQTEMQVFDSTVQTQYITTDKRFVYLNVPVLLGYDFIRKNNFTLGLRAGPGLSVLLSKKQDDPHIVLGQNQVLQVNLLTPERKVMNWQVSGGLNFTFISKHNYYFEIEPGFSWYFNQAGAESDSKKSPYSIGLRLAAGILKKQ